MRNYLKPIALSLIFSLLGEILLPLSAYALTGGPSQPEVTAFQSIGAGGMVDPFTGDFSYGIPLMEVGGYPISLNYKAGIGPDQEASWAGLGWDLSVGAIIRNMRGLPDEFAGDTVKSEQNLKPNWSLGFSYGSAWEFFGKEEDKDNRDTFKLQKNLTAELGIYYNSYRGLGMTIGADFGMLPGKLANMGPTVGLGLQFDTQNGTTVSPQLGFMTRIQKLNHGLSNFSPSLSAPINSRQGMKGLHLSAGFNTGSMAKNKLALGETMGSANFQFSHPTYIPYLPFPQQTFTQQCLFKWGKNETFWSNRHNLVKGWWSVQDLEVRRRELPAYGYLRAQNGVGHEDALHDFNREKEGAFTPNTPHLPLTNLTYDTYSLSAYGLGGVFRAHRGDIGVVYDPLNKTLSGSPANLGVEFNSGSLQAGDLGVGINISSTLIHAKAGPWENGNDAYPSLNFVGESPYHPEFELACFKLQGEQTEPDAGFDGIMGPQAPTRISLKRQKAEAGLEGGSGSGVPSLPLNGQVRRQERLRRNTLVQPLNNREASQFGHRKTIPNYNLQGDSLQFTPLDRLSQPAHHLGEMRVTAPGGARYVYGIPAYNLHQREVNFAIGASEFDGNPPARNCQEGLAPYAPGVDNSIDNQKGRDHFFQSNELPPYAHAYLLTEFLSPDYEDLTGDGPSPDDGGTYVKFNYGKLDQAYRWRSPVQENQAKYDEGLRGDPTDDKAGYVYGEKEVWYLRSIESRDYIAIFTLKDREDAFGVKGENGGIDATLALQAIDQIDLYARAEKLLNPQASPIQTVQLHHSYTLCPNTPNSRAPGGGKLTLDGLTITHYDSKKGTQHPYIFHYQDSPNYSYSLKTQDRWGSYTPLSDPNCTQASNAQFPYTRQDSALAAQYAAVWSLNRIELPSGGEINIDYEADEYAYVQNRPAMNMVPITGLSDQPHDPLAPQERTLHEAGPDGKLHNYVYFALSEAIPEQPGADHYFQEQYADPLGQYLSFRASIELDRPAPDHHFGRSHYEWVPGYAKIRSTGLDEASKTYDPQLQKNVYTGAWIELQPEPIGDRDQQRVEVHPFAKAAWQTAHLAQPQLIYPAYDPGTNPLEAIKGLAGFGLDLKVLFTSFNRQMRNRGYGRHIQPEQSRIRIPAGAGIKYGGGHRVKRIRISDAWDQMAPGQAAFETGQEYIYRDLRNVADLDGDGSLDQQEFSSGVASYEPLFGGEENPFRQPLEYVNANYLAPDERFFMEEPLGESMFPAATVGYSKVTVRPLQHAGVTGVGFVVNEFYTAKDFPTQVRATGIEIKRDRIGIAPPLRLTTQDHLTCSEGYHIERNDMHGRPKASWTYGESAQLRAGSSKFSLSNAPISGVEYIYRTDSTDPTRLDNQVLVIRPDEQLAYAELGLERSAISDMRQSSQRTQAPRIGLNINMKDVNGNPLPLFTAFPDLMVEDVRFRSAVLTRTTDRSGILEKVIAHDHQAQIPTENLAWDTETGEVLLTRSWNEYAQPVYSLSLPAHWAYPGMGPAYRNAGLRLPNLARPEIHTLQSTTLSPALYLSEGDEVYLQQGNGNREGPYWINELGLNGEIFLVDREGRHDSKVSVSGNVDLTVLRPGRRNQHLNAIGGLLSLRSPLDLTRMRLKLDGGYEDYVLQASAVEYRDEWQMACDFSSDPVSGGGGGSGGCDFYSWQLFCNALAGAGLFDTHSLPVNVDTLIGNGVWGNGLGNGNGGLCWQSQMRPPISYNEGGRFMGNLGLCGGDRLCRMELSPLPQGEMQILAFDSIYPDLATPSQQDFYALVRYGPASSDTVTLRGQSNCPCLGGSGSGGGLLVSGSDDLACGKVEGEAVNPWIQGVRGHYRPFKSHVWLSDRYREDAGTKVREEGVYTDFLPFWTRTTGEWRPTGDSETRWQFASAATVYHPRGIETGSVDPLGHHTAALLGYDESLVTAMGANVRARQMAFDNFEDYVLRDPNECSRDHFGFAAYRNRISTDLAHSGLSSLKVAGSPVTLRHEIKAPVSKGGFEEHEYLLGECDCTERFSPDAGQRYVFHAWVSEQEAHRDNYGKYTYTLPQVRITFSDGAGQALPQHYTFQPTGAIIDGWQRIEAEFEIPLGAKDLTLTLSLPLGTADAVYFDDLRIQPYDALVSSYVYHPYNRRLMAELDQNHYATFYEYDESGALIRVKKESERGIQTLSETRTNLHKKH